MSNPVLKNIAFEQALDLPALAAYGEGQVVSRTFVQSSCVSLTLFAFDKEEEISTHSSEGDAMVQIFEGKARITIGGQEHVLEAGQSIVMPAGVPHALFALERFKMLLTVVFPQKT